MTLLSTVTRQKAVLTVIGAMALLATQPGLAAAVVHPASYVMKSTTTTVAAGGSGAATATCPNGDLVVIGGAYWHPTGSDISDPTLDTYIRSSAPLKTVAGWYATGSNATGQTMQLTTIAQCLPKSAIGSVTVKTREVVVDPHRPGSADLACGTNRIALSGGGIWHKPGAQPKASLNAWITSDYPENLANSWLVAGWNDSATILDLRVSAVCVTKAMLVNYGISGSVGSTHIGNTREDYHACSSGYAVATGGAWWGYTTGADTDTMDHLESNSVTADASAWYAAGRNTDLRRSESTEYFSLTTVCVSLS